MSETVAAISTAVVPRKKKDGLKGFFWPRRAYKDAQEIEATLQALHSAIAGLRDS